MYQWTHPSIPTLPDTLLTHSKAFLCKTSLFDLHHQVIDNEPCEIDLRNYTHLSSPIYEDSKSQQALLDLLHAINGRQLNLLQAAGERQYEESASGFREVTETARDNLQHMLDSWCHVESLPWPEDGTTASLVHAHSLEWGVKAIVDLFTELEVQRVLKPSMCRRLDRGEWYHNNAGGYYCDRDETVSLLRPDLIWSIFRIP